MIDSPKDTPRGGGSLETTAANTGRKPRSYAPQIKTIPNADVRFMTLSGKPIRGTRSHGDGSITRTGFPEIAVGERLLMLATDEETTESKIVTTIGPSRTT